MLEDEFDGFQGGGRCSSAELGGHWYSPGAGSVITRNVPDHGLAYGNPARLIGFVCTCERRFDDKEATDEVIRLRCSNCGSEIFIPAATYREMK